MLARIARTSRWTVIKLCWEAFSLLLPITDVSFDVYICINFYHADRMAFFYSSLGAFLIAQIAYVIFFIQMYAGKRSTAYQTAAFFVLLPFGQLIPLLIWTQGLNLGWLNRAFERCGLNVEVEDNPTAATSDPLKLFLDHKLRSHRGFLVEAIAQAVPQSVLQTTAVVLSDRAPGFIQLLSISLSMASMSSHGCLVSYCIDRTTFIFNCLCFFADVFNVFATVSFLFFTESGRHGDLRSTPFEPNPVSIYAIVWFSKEIALVGAFALFWILFHIVTIIEEYERAKARAGRVSCGEILTQSCKFLVVGLIGTILFCPFMVMVEILKFSLLPLLVLNALESPHGQFYNFYRKLFGFLSAGDFIEKARVANRFFANKFLSARPPSARTLRADRTLRDQYEAAKNVIVMTDDNPTSHFTLAKLRSVSGLTVRGLLSKYSSVISDERSRHGQGPMPWSKKLELLDQAYFNYVLVPLVLLSGLYSLVFPLLQFSWGPDLGPLQTLFTTFFACTLFCLAILAYPVFKFMNTTVHVNMFALGCHVHDAWIDKIEAQYRDLRARTIMRQTLLDDLRLPTVLVDLCCDYYPTFMARDADLHNNTKLQLLSVPRQGWQPRLKMPLELESPHDADDEEAGDEADADLELGHGAVTTSELASTSVTRPRAHTASTTRGSSDATAAARPLSAVTTGSVSTLRTRTSDPMTLNAITEPNTSSAVSPVPPGAVTPDEATTSATATANGRRRARTRRRTRPETKRDRSTHSESKADSTSTSPTEHKRFADATAASAAMSRSASSPHLRNGADLELASVDEPAHSHSPPGADQPVRLFGSYAAWRPAVQTEQVQTSPPGPAVVANSELLANWLLPSLLVAGLPPGTPPAAALSPLALDVLNAAVAATQRQLQLEREHAIQQLQMQQQLQQQQPPQPVVQVPVFQFQIAPSPSARSVTAAPAAS